MTDMSNFRQMDEKTLRQTIETIKKDLRDMRFQKAMDVQFDLNKYRMTKKNVARLFTVLAEKK